MFFSVFIFLVKTLPLGFVAREIFDSARKRKKSLKDIWHHWGYVTNRKSSWTFSVVVTRVTRLSCHVNLVKLILEWNLSVYFRSSLSDHYLRKLDITYDASEIALLIRLVVRWRYLSLSQ